MRVSMKNGSAQTSCEVFAVGELEDYTVNMNTITGVYENNSGSFSIYPNPVSTVLKAEMVPWTMNTVRVSSITRKVVKEFQFVSGTFVMDVSDLSAGVYFIEVTNVLGRKVMKKFVVGK